MARIDITINLGSCTGTLLLPKKKRPFIMILKVNTQSISVKQIIKRVQIKLAGIDEDIAAMDGMVRVSEVNS